MTGNTEDRSATAHNRSVEYLHPKRKINKSKTVYLSI